MKSLITLIGIGLFGISSSHALSVGQVDTFEDGTTQNWIINLLGIGAPPSAALPANIATGGPAGVDDNYLRLTALGSGGAGGRLTVLNLSQWAGNYQASGIHAIKMDVNNLGSTDLALRLLFEDPEGGPPSNIAISQNAILIPPASGWQSIVFPIQPSDLTALLGTVEEALKNTTAVRIFHSVDPLFPGAPVAAQLGVDNIQAVPEASTTCVSLAVGFLALGLLRRWSA
jgi:hypothetical protein